jgi:N-acetyl-anhydromuramyl-L-alanine amidase AmpD
MKPRSATGRVLLAAAIAGALPVACATLRPIARPAMDWVPSAHFRAAARTPADIDAIVVHTTEGLYRPGVPHAQNQRRSYVGTIAYFRRNDRNVSAHFVIGPGGEVTQMVREQDIAHATTYYNARSIGIECAGWGDRAETWTPELYDRLVELCAYLCVTWDVPIVHPEGTAYESPHSVPTDDPQRPRFDAPGLVGHFQVQPWNKADPGPHFPWADFVARVAERARGHGRNGADLLHVPVVRRGQWQAEPVDPASMRPHEARRITLHHSGVAVPDWPQVDGKAWLQHLERYSRAERGHADVPYHYSVMPDGTVFAGRDPEFVGDTNTSYDPAGHLLVEVVGDFDRAEPPPAQLDAVVRLCAWLAARHGVPPERIGGHRDFAATSCPGELLYARLESGELRSRVRQALAGAGPP